MKDQRPKKMISFRRHPLRFYRYIWKKEDQELPTTFTVVNIKDRAQKLYYCVNNRKNKGLIILTK